MTAADMVAELISEVDERSKSHITSASFEI